MGGDVDGFLAGGGVEDEENFLGLDEVAEADEFLDEGFVDLQAAGGVEDEGVAIVGLGKFERAAGDFQNVGLALLNEGGNLDLAGEGLQLVHGGGAIDVRGDEQGGAALLEEKFGELGAGGGLAGAVEADHEDAGGIAAEVEGGIGGAEEFDEFVIDDLDDLLAGMDGVDDFLAGGLGLEQGGRIAGYLQINVGLR